MTAVRPPPRSSTTPSPPPTERRLSALLGETRWVEAAGMPYGGTHHGLAEIVDKVFGPIGHDVAGFTAVPDEIVAIGA